MANGLKTIGTPSLEELKRTPGFPDEETMKRGPIAVIECVEEIPCNPCETACPHGAIFVGDPITNLPVLYAERCRGCGLCLPACPGLAIYLKDYTFSAERVLITFPFEYLPLPEKGETVSLVDRMGKTVCPGEVIRVSTAKRNDRTALVSVAYAKESFFEVVGMKRLARE
jgi:Fe-S-cluster-containing hydrogenase component 2